MRQTGTREPTPREKREWTKWGPNDDASDLRPWNIEFEENLITRHIFDGQLPFVPGKEGATLGELVVQNAKGKSEFHLGNNKDETVIWIIFRNLLNELQNLAPRAQSVKNVGACCRRRQIGKLIWQLMTRGKSYSVIRDIAQLLQPDPLPEASEDHQNDELRQRYSIQLLTYVYQLVEVPGDSNYERIKTTEILNYLDRQELHADLDATIPIPIGLSLEQQAVYHELRKVIKIRRNAKQVPPHLLVISDLGKDYDDLVAMAILKEFHRLGLVYIEDYVANLMPAHERARFGRAALDLLGLPKVGIAEGTAASIKDHKILDHEFTRADAAGGWMSSVPKDQVFDKGIDFIHDICQRAVNESRKLSLVLLSSLTDINEYAQMYGATLKRAISNVSLQGQYEITDGKLVPDEGAANNRFDFPAAHAFHKYMEHNKIPSLVWTKVPTLAMKLHNQVFVDLKDTGHPLGAHLQYVQIAQEAEFFKAAWGPVGGRFAPFMDGPWYLDNKSTWWTAENPDGTPVHKRGKDASDAGDAPKSYEEVLPYLNKVAVYDALAAVGSAGDDILDALNILQLPAFQAGYTHRYAGISAKTTPDGEKIAAQECVQLENMTVVVSAMLRGSMLACQQANDDKRFKVKGQ